MRHFAFITLILLLVLGPDWIAAQGFLTSGTPAETGDHLTLDTLIAQALRGNQMLLAYRTGVREAEARVPQSTAWPDPLFGFTFEETPASSANPFDANVFRYSLQQMIPFPGKTSAAREVARAGISVAGSRVAILERAIIAEVKGTYAMLYTLQRQQDLNREDQELLATMARSLEESYAVSQASQADLLRLQIELSKLRNEAARLSQEEFTAISKLNLLRGDSAHRPIGRIADLRVRKFTLDLVELTRKACLECTDLQKIKNEIEMTRAERTMTERDRLPDFMVGAMYMQMRDMPNRWDLMLGVTIPIAPWSEGKYSGRIDEAESRIRRLEAEYADMTNMIAQGIRSEVAKAEARWEEMERYRLEILPQAKQAFTSLVTQYQARRTDFLSMLDAFRMQNMYRRDYYMALADYMDHIAEIEKEIGAELN